MSRSLLEKATRLHARSFSSQDVIVVLGAGPTGLTTSILLSKLGIRNVVLEKASKLTEHPQVGRRSHRRESVLAHQPRPSNNPPGSLHQQPHHGDFPAHGWPCRRGPIAEPAAGDLAQVCLLRDPDWPPAWRGERFSRKTFIPLFCESDPCSRPQVDHFAGQSEPRDPRISPEGVSHLSQDRLLPLLLRRAREAGAEVHFGHEVEQVGWA